MRYIDRESGAESAKEPLRTLKLVNTLETANPHKQEPDQQAEREDLEYQESWCG
jgi:hypothetical protein